MRNFVLSTLAAIAFFSLSSGTLNQVKAQATTVDPQTAAALQAKLEELHTTFDLKGLSASVIIPGKGTWNGVVGVSHGSLPIDTAMVFAFASITKTFTAAAILMLQEDSLLTLSDSLHKFLPTYPNIDSSITIKQLLQHTSGIYNYFNHPDWINAVNSNPSQALSRQFVLTNFIETPYFAPGTSYEYSNTNYMLLGLIIEEVSGQSYASFIRQHLLDPLQPSSLYVGEHEPAIGVTAHNWQFLTPSGPGTDISGIPLTSIFGTSAAEVAMMGNAYDLARLAKLLFTGQILQDTSLQLMTEFTPLSAGLFSGYGLGLMRFATGNGQAWGHNGGIRGFSTCLMYSPADSIVVSILGNKFTNSNTLAWSLLAVARQNLANAVPGGEDNLQGMLLCSPNPAQKKGEIRYEIQVAQQVEITLQNSLGQTVQTLLRQAQEAGKHSLSVDTSKLPSGIYYCMLQTNSMKLVQRWFITH